MQEQTAVKELKIRIMSFIEKLIATSTCAKRNEELGIKHNAIELDRAPPPLNDSIDLLFGLDPVWENQQNQYMGIWWPKDIN